MSKRKRDDFEGAARRVLHHKGANHGEEANGLRAVLVRAKEDLHSALKLARGFERQKMGRRQKQASNDPKTLLRLREEVIVLKQLDLAKTASNYLIKHLSKAKRVRQSEAFQKLYGSDPQVEAVAQGATANVIGRLANSAPVKNAISNVMASVYRTLGLVDNASAQKSALPTDGLQDRPQIRNPDTSTSVDVRLRPDPDHEDDNAKGSSFEVNDDLHQVYQHRLASSEDDSSGSLSPNGQDISRSASPSGPAIEQNKAATSFLPTLNMGGYYSGSEPEDSDYEDIDDTKSRKNRRGQRARQQIAEMKYGTNARHLQNQKGKDKNSTSWDPRRGAVHHRDSRKPRKYGQWPNEHSNSRPSLQNKGGHAGKSVKPGQQERDNTGPLHPSWEAAKLRKSHSESQARFSGKKTTFD